MTRTLLCFGDSNTWGYDPETGSRLERNARWPVRLGAALGADWEVVAEGLNGRMATIDSPSADGRNGLPYLVPCLLSHAPIDLLVIYLGTNDAYRLDADDVAKSVGRLVKLARTTEAGPDGEVPEILVVCPPPFDGHSLGAAFAEVAALVGFELLDLDSVVSYSPIDLIHLDANGNAAVAAAVEEQVRRLCP